MVNPNVDRGPHDRFTRAEKIEHEIELNAEDPRHPGALRLLLLQFRLQRAHAPPRPTGSGALQVLAGARRPRVESWVQSARTQRDSAHGRGVPRNHYRGMA